MRRMRGPAFVALLFFSAGCDQLTKHLARELLSDSSAVSLGAGTVRFELIQNVGGFLSLGTSLPEAASPTGSTGWRIAAR